MTLILEDITIPEKGHLEFNVTVAVDINITAKEARRKVDHWLMDQVSHMIGAQEPSLVILGEKAVWRVPAWIAFTGGRWAGVIGQVDVDVESGEMLEPEKQKAAIIEYLETEVKPKLLPYQPQAREVPPEYLANDVPRGKRLIVAEDGQLKTAE